MIRLLLFLVALATLQMSASASASEIVSATLYKNPDCICCEKYADYLRTNGFNVAVIEHPNMTLIKKRHGVREDLQGCHTLVVDGYVVEGHVPITPIRRLLADKPPAKGISLPGMPEGSPGMGGTKQRVFEILTITGEDGPVPVFGTE